MRRHYSVQFVESDFNDKLCIDFSCRNSKGDQYRRSFQMRHNCAEGAPLVCVADLLQSLAKWVGDNEKILT